MEADERRHEMTNDEISACEVQEWNDNPPARYFAYVKLNDQSQFTRSGLLTTWTGDMLGTVKLGSVYRSNMGDKRQSIRVNGTNGRRYHGTYYVGTGDYARIKVCKGD